MSERKMIGIEIEKGEDLHVDLNYSTRPLSSTVEIGLCDVRSADDIRVRFDFPRDGWSVYQASRFCWNVEDEEQDADWQEVAFIPAWGREETEEQTNERLSKESRS